MLDSARWLIDGSENDITLAIWPLEAGALGANLERASQRGVNITTLCLANCPQKCELCRGRVYRHTVESIQDERWLMVIPDGQEILAGGINPDGETQAVRTHQTLLVVLATLYIHQYIALATLLHDLGSRRGDLLGQQTINVLATLAPGVISAEWLDRLQ